MPFNTTYYQTLHDEAVASGASIVQAACEVADVFLDGKPSGKATGNDRQAAFWSSPFIEILPPEAWAQESLHLALTRYLGQDHQVFPGLVAHLANIAPDSVRLAARHAGLVLRQTSPRFGEIEALATSDSQEFSEFVRIFYVLRQAREERLIEVERFRRPLIGLTPLELVAYASLYAFEFIVPAQLAEPSMDADSVALLQTRWDAIDRVIEWKLETCEIRDFRLDDAAIGRSLRTHLMPFLMPSPQEPPRHDLYAAFSALVEAQVELDEFDARSADAFSYDDSIRFVRRDAVLEIEVVDPEEREHWRSGEQKRLRLHGYWLRRGMDALLESSELLARIGSAHLEANLQAAAKAKAAWLCLWEVYGIETRMEADGDAQLDVFNALLTIELMTAFYIEDFMLPYRDALQQCGNPWLALGMLAMSGFVQGENRLPFTWSEKAAKVARITPWTASVNRPQGHPRAAEAILDFWTSDWELLAKRLRSGEPGLHPRLQERPILKLGRHLFQLPWMQAMQDNRVAAINNLRRLGARRVDTRDETRRIEQRLGGLFSMRDFKVLVGHELSVSSDANAQTEEIDLLCARDGCLLVLEVKSTFVRRSMKDKRLHRTTTLRKAGLQLRRKVAVVRRSLEANASLKQALGLDMDAAPALTAWIVDTSIECDHRRFSGFLKVSMEEIIIALRDDKGLLGGLHGIIEDDTGNDETLYPDGFLASGFVDVIESEAVWAG